MKPTAQTTAKLLLLGLVVLALGCADGSAVAMPNELVGFWRTSAEGYQDRYLVLTPLEVRIGTSETTSTVHEISKVQQLGEAAERVYRITYLSAEGKEYWLSLQYEAGNGSLRLVNQPQIEWRRTQSFE